MRSHSFLTPEKAQDIRRQFGTPTFVYDAKTLVARAQEALAFPNASGLTVRYAMKAASNRAILKLFDGLGLHIDASSGFEVERALLAGIAPQKISLSSQEWFPDFPSMHQKGVLFNACSLSQLRRFGDAFPGAEVGLRFNPGVGSGGTLKTNVGGPASSFGIWSERMPEVRKIVEERQLNVVRIHTHIGSGSDPRVWQRVVELTLRLVDPFPSLQTVNLGGGFKVGRMPEEVSTDLSEVGAPVKAQFEALSSQLGRPLHLEIEPGTFLLANAGALLATVQDQAETGDQGYHFLKLDAGMTEILRPSLYASQHPIDIFQENRSEERQSYVVVGHCCESGDLLTPSADDPSGLAPRELPKATIGDLAVLAGVGAYCASMSAKNYNSFPEAAEVLIDTDGVPRLIRRRQSLDQILANEIDPDEGA